MSCKVYTKTGDKGTTSLVGGTRVSKGSLQLEAYGTADELNSFIGLLRAQKLPQEIDGVLHRVQNKLFNLGGFLATEAEEVACEDESGVKRVRKTWESTEIAEEEVRILEKAIDEIQKELDEEEEEKKKRGEKIVRGFILPTGDEATCLCHVCRTVCRRLERRMVELFEVEGSGDEKSEICLQYVNRLSDYLFILSKKITKMRKNCVFLWEK